MSPGMLIESQRREETQHDLQAINHETDQVLTLRLCVSNPIPEYSLSRSNPIKNTRVGPRIYRIKRMKKSSHQSQRASSSRDSKLRSTKNISCERIDLRERRVVPEKRKLQHFAKLPIQCDMNICSNSWATYRRPNSAGRATLRCRRHRPTKPLKGGGLRVFQTGIVGEIRGDVFEAAA